MDISVMFLINSVFLGVGLAMDAFSVSLANGFAEPHMKKAKHLGIAGVFAGFQAIMPLIGWLCAHTIVTFFEHFEKFLPWFSLVILGYIGAKMICDGFKNDDEAGKKESLKLGALAVQGVATSIDALSVGPTIATYDALKAVICALIVALVTFVICTAGVAIGKKFGTKLAGKATVAGGVILVLIGIEIFVKGIFF